MASHTPMKTCTPMKFDTTVVRAGIAPDPTTGAIVPPIYQTATYVLDEVGKDKGFDYTRSTNPTRQVLEANLAAIEGGAHGVCYSSGMSAVDSCMKLLSAGDHVVCSDDVYGGVSRHFNKVLGRYGLSFTYVAFAGFIWSSLGDSILRCSSLRCSLLR